MRAVVVGAGVVGLSAAVRLREAGIDADVVARDDAAGHDLGRGRGALVPLPRPAGRARHRVVGADLRRPGRAGRGARQRRAHARGHRAAGARRARPVVARRPCRASSARARACASSLPPSTCRSTCRGSWRACARSAARVERREVASLDELDADAVVNCAGLGARELAGDAVAGRGARPGPPRGGARGARVAARPVRPAAPGLRRAARQRRRARRHRGRGRRGPHARPGDDRGDPRALRGADPGAARRAGGRRRRRAAARRARRCAWRPRAASCTATATAAPA